MGGLRLSKRGFLFRLGAAVAGINLLLAGLAWLSLGRSYRQYCLQAEVTAQNLTQVLEQNVAGAIDKIDVGAGRAPRPAGRDQAHPGPGHRQVDHHRRAAGEPA